MNFGVTCFCCQWAGFRCVFSQYASCDKILVFGCPHQPPPATLPLLSAIWVASQQQQQQAYLYCAGICAASTTAVSYTCLCRFPVGELCA